MKYFTDYQKQILDGLMLGDGCLTIGCNSRNACLRICRTRRDENYLRRNAEVFKDFITPKGVRYSETNDKRTKKKYEQIRLRSVCHPLFTEFYNRWYIDGIKKIPKDLKLTYEMVKIWMADDGCVIPPKDKLNRLRFGIKFATHSFLEEEVEFLKNQLDKLFDVSFHKCEELNKKDIKQYTLHLWKTDDCRKFLRSIDEDFPLDRKSKIWRRKEYRLFEEIPEKPNCKHCGSSVVSKNGKNQYSKQKYFCNDCNKNFTDGKWSITNE